MGVRPFFLPGPQTLCLRTWAQRGRREKERGAPLTQDIAKKSAKTMQFNAIQCKKLFFTSMCVNNLLWLGARPAKKTAPRNPPCAVKLMLQALWLGAQELGEPPWSCARAMRAPNMGHSVSHLCCLQSRPPLCPVPGHTGKAASFMHLKEFLMLKILRLRRRPDVDGMCQQLCGSGAWRYPGKNRWKVCTQSRGLHLSQLPAGTRPCTQQRRDNAPRASLQLKACARQYFLQLHGKRKRTLCHSLGHYGQRPSPPWPHSVEGFCQAMLSSVARIATVSLPRLILGHQGQHSGKSFN